MGKPDEQKKNHEFHDQLEAEREREKEMMETHSQKGYDKRVHFEEEIKHEHKH